MAQQNQRIYSERSGSGKKILGSSITLISKKISQLQNKAFFFQGQLNPIVIQNQNLKVKITWLNKKVISSTDMLRLLIPIGTNESLRLKLQLANIEQISQMIKQSWHQMQQQITRKTFAIDVLQKKVMSNKVKYQTQFLKFKQTTTKQFQQKQQQLKIMRQKIEFVQNQLQKVTKKSRTDIEEIHQKYKMRIQRAQKLQIGFQLYKKQVKQKYRIYDKSIQKLNQQIKNHLDKFQDAKKNLKQIYDQIMQDRLDQQNQNFQFLLKTKQQQKDRLIAYFQQKQNQLSKQLKNKSIDIQNLHKSLCNKKQQIKQRDNTIQIKSHKISQLYNQIDEQNNQKALLNTKIQQIQHKLSIIQDQFIKKEKQYLRQISQQNQIYTQTKKQLMTKISNLSQQKIDLQSELTQKTFKLKNTEKSLATFQRKFNQMIEQQKQKFQLLIKQNKKNILALEEKFKLKDNECKKLSNQLIKEKQMNRTKLQQLEMTKNRQFQQMRKAHQRKFENFNQQNAIFISSLKQQHIKLLSEQRLLANKQIQRITIQNNDNMRLREIEFNRIKQNMEQQLNRKSKQLLQNRLKMELIQSKLIDAQKYILQMKQSHDSEINLMRINNQQRLKDIQKKYQQQKNNIKKEMLNQLLAFQIQMQNKQNQYNNQLKRIKNQMMDQIKLLKSSNALQELEMKLLQQIQKLKRQHSYQISQMQQQQKQSQNSLVEEQNRKIEQLIKQYEQDMTKLAKRLETDISKLNQQLLSEQTDHQITKMTREQKIQYLCKKIQELKQIISNKNIKILQLQMEIQYLKSEIDKIQSIVQQKVKERKQILQMQKIQLEKHFNQTIQKIRAEANKKVNQAEKQRLKHTHDMFSKFNQLRQYNEIQISKWNKKYFELEKIFCQRPSRAQDVSKIKQLLSKAQKFEIQIDQYQKKAQQANQIAKYLNLQLQNYKDNYDMFGPNQQIQEKTFNVESPKIQIQSKNNIRRKKIIQKLHTQGSDNLLNSINRYQAISPKIMHKKMFNQNYDTKQISLFPSIILNQSPTMFSQSQITDDQRKMSNLKNPDLINKSIKSRSFSNQIVLNAQNFLSLIRNNSKPPIKEQRLNSNGKKSYRKLKPRRLNTLGVGAGQVFHF